MENQRKHLEIVPTEDGTPTLYNAHFDECCHSTSGAYQETITHYFDGCQVAEKLSSNPNLNILEVGFGSGLGLKVTIEQARINKLTNTIKFISLELDRASCDWALEHTEIDDKPLKHFLHYRDHLLIGQIDQMSVMVILGDARRELPRFMQSHPLKFDCIYQDAFSPKKNPQLWSIEWFKFLKSIALTNTILSTYSSSISIRKSLHLAGWTVYEGVRFGNKRSSTRATLQGEISQTILQSFERSPAQAIIEQELEFKESLKC
jgi:tRNA U34 5-methylaminomethyl-2-thiouridine-forming methyltransferase MnmC